MIYTPTVVQIQQGVSRKWGNNILDEFRKSLLVYSQRLNTLVEIVLELQDSVEAVQDETRSADSSLTFSEGTKKISET